MRRFFSALTWWLGGLAAAAAAAIALLGQLPLAVGTALGALFGYLNLRLLGRSVHAVLVRAASTPPPSEPAVPEADDPDILEWSESPNYRPDEGLGGNLEGRDSVRGSLLRLLALGLALLLILWYMPARTEGIALGLGLSLLAAVIAGIQTNRSH